MKYHIRYFIDQLLFANDRKRCKATFRKDISSIIQTRFSNLNS